MSLGFSGGGTSLGLGFLLGFRGGFLFGSRLSLGFSGGVGGLGLGFRSSLCSRFLFSRSLRLLLSSSLLSLSLSFRLGLRSRSLSFRGSARGGGLLSLGLRRGFSLGRLLRVSCSLLLRRLRSRLRFLLSSRGVSLCLGFSLGVVRGRFVSRGLRLLPRGGGVRLRLRFSLGLRCSFLVHGGGTRRSRFLSLGLRRGFSLGGLVRISRGFLIRSGSISLRLLLSSSSALRRGGICLFALRNLRGGLFVCRFHGRFARGFLLRLRLVRSRLRLGALNRVGFVLGLGLGLGLRDDHGGRRLRLAL